MQDVIIEDKVAGVLSKIQQYPANIQVGVLKYYILYMLKGESKEKIIAQCTKLKSKIHALQAKETNLNEPREREEGKANSTKAINSIAAHLGVKLQDRKSDAEKLSEINEAVNELEVALREVVGFKKVEDVTVSELLVQIIDDEKKTKTLINETAGEMFDRILASLDPAKADRFLDQSIMREGVEKKAALYDAMCEKYEQLSDYNENGRFVKDFRLLFRGKMK